MERGGDRELGGMIQDMRMEMKYMMESLNKGIRQQGNRLREEMKEMRKNIKSRRKNGKKKKECLERKWKKMRKRVEGLEGRLVEIEEARGGEEGGKKGGIKRRLVEI